MKTREPSDDGFILPETGIHEIDRQHRELLKSVWELTEWIDVPSEMAAVFSAISNLNDSVDKHFQYEEKFLAEQGYKHLEEHIKRHNCIRAQVVELTSEILEGTEITKEILATMTDWIVGHIKEEDLEYAKFLVGNKN